MSIKLGTGGKMVFRRGVPDSDMNWTTDVGNFFLCQFNTFKTEVIPSIMQKTSFFPRREEV